MTQCYRCHADTDWDNAHRKYCVPCMKILKKEYHQKYQKSYKKKPKMSEAQLKARKAKYDRSYWQRPEVKTRRNMRDRQKRG